MSASFISLSFKKHLLGSLLKEWGGDTPLQGSRSSGPTLNRHLCFLFLSLPLSPCSLTVISLFSLPPPPSHPSHLLLSSQAGAEPLLGTLLGTLPLSRQLTVISVYPQVLGASRGHRRCPRQLLPQHQAPCGAQDPGPPQAPPRSWTLPTFPPFSPLNPATSLLCVTSALITRWLISQYFKHWLVSLTHVIRISKNCHSFGGCWPCSALSPSITSFLPSSFYPS